jgi:nitrilase
LRTGEGDVIEDLDFSLIDRRKVLMDASGHYSRPEVLSLRIDHTPRAPVHEESRDDQPVGDAADIDHASL